LTVASGLPASSILENFFFSAFNGIEYIFEWEITELDRLWHKTEYCSSWTGLCSKSVDLNPSVTMSGYWIDGHRELLALVQRLSIKQIFNMIT